MKQLTESKIDRENILNNPYAIKPIQEVLWLSFPLFEGEMRITTKQVADFFEVDTRTIERSIEQYKAELTKNGYEVFTWKRLAEAKLSFGTDIDVGTKTTVLGLFNFRAFLNIGMILTDSEKAKELRSVILDIVIDVMRQKTGWKTKYINQRDETFLQSYVDNINYRKEFTDALHKYVNAGASKYPLMTNKIYHAVFGEQSRAYKLLLKLNSHDKIKHTLYREVLDVISQYELWFAEYLSNKYHEQGEKFSYNETERLFDQFIQQKVLIPTRERARSLMASRDKALRDVFHESLQPYIQSLSPEDSEQFLADYGNLVEEKTNEALWIIDKNKDIFIRLRDR